MKQLLTLTLILLAFFSKANDSVAVFKTSKQYSTITLNEIRPNYPNTGYTTVYSTIRNIKGKGISHSNIKVKECVGLYKGGTYSHRDTLNYNSCFRIGKDGSDKIDSMYGIKYDCEIKENDSANIFYIIKGDYDWDTSLVKIKFGTEWASSIILSPKCKKPLPVKLISFTSLLINNKLNLNNDIEFLNDEGKSSPRLVKKEKLIEILNGQKWTPPSITQTQKTLELN